MTSFGKITTNSIEEIISTCITKSMSVIEQLCPKSEVTKGLVERDDYHGDTISNISMLTSCQMLWAVTTAGTYAQSHYLIIDLLTAIKQVLGAGYFEKKDRSFEKSFLLLSTTSAPMQFQDPLYIMTINQILDSQDQNGYWGTCKGEPSDKRATALNIIALSECHKYVGDSEEVPYSLIPNSVSKACRWLENQYNEKGYCERNVPGIEVGRSQHTFGVELTAWCTYALIRAMDCGCYTNNKNNRKSTIDIIKKSIEWLISLDFDKVATTPEIEQEVYVNNLSKPEEKKIHGYGAGSIEILILALIYYRESMIYQHINDYERSLQNAIVRLTQNMNSSGEWYDKNTDSFSRAWTLAYALKALTAYQFHLDSKNKFKEQLIQNVKIVVLTIPGLLWRYIIAIVFIVFTVLAMNYGDLITQYVEFLNSKTCTAIGFVCTVLGFLMGLRK